MGPRSNLRHRRHRSAALLQLMAGSRNKRIQLQIVQLLEALERSFGSTYRGDDLSAVLMTAGVGLMDVSCAGP